MVAPGCGMLFAATGGKVRATSSIKKGVEMIIEINRRRMAVHMLSVYFLWPMLPLVFGCIWGINFGYANWADLQLIHWAIKVPSIVWWLLSPITFFVTLLLSIASLIFPGPKVNFLFAGVSPCVMGDWNAFPMFVAEIGWLFAYALCLFLAAKVCSCQRLIEIFGKRCPLSLLLKAFCCVISVASLFLCSGRGPYDAQSDNERNVFEILKRDEAVSGEERFGYRFVSDKLAVPLEYGRGNRARTFCKVSVYIDPKILPRQAGIEYGKHTFVLVKDTGGKIEPLPEVVPSKQDCFGLGAMYKLGWRW